MKFRFSIFDMFSKVVLIQFVYFLDKQQHKSRDTHQIRIQHSNSAYLSNGQTYNNYDLVPHIGKFPAAYLYLFLNFPSHLMHILLIT